MQLDVDDMSVREIYSWMVGLITPRPIAWVSTVSRSGKANLAPYSFFNGVGANPPTLMFCPANNRHGAPKDTLANIQQTGQFVVNVVTSDVIEAMNLTSAEVEADVDEFELAELAKRKSARVSPPSVQAAKASFECELLQAIQLGVGPGGANLVIGRILCIHADSAIIDSDGKFDHAKLETVGRMGGNDYVRTTDRLTVSRPSRPRKGH